MSDNPATSTAIPQDVLDRLVPDYRAFVEAQPPSSRLVLHTLTWSPAFRQVSAPPNFGQAPAVPVGSTRTIELCDGRFSVRVLTPEGEKPSEGWPVMVFAHGGGFVFGTVESGSPFYSRACAGEFPSALDAVSLN
jgi:acetyl esterase/lipase